MAVTEDVAKQIDAWIRALNTASVSLLAHTSQAMQLKNTKSFDVYVEVAGMTFEIS